MSKQITRNQLAHILCRLLLGEEFDTEEQSLNFMTDAAELVTKHCGGQLSSQASNFDDVTYVGVTADESLPSNGGIWREYDVEGDLFDGDSPCVEVEPTSKGVAHTFMVSGVDFTPKKFSFDIGGQFTVAEALELIRVEDDPQAAFLAVVTANIEYGELGFTSELVSAFGTL